VTITYVDGGGANQNYAVFNAGNGSSINVSIPEPEIVQSVTVSLADAYDGNSSTNMSVSFSQVSYCISGGSQARSIPSTSDVNDSLGKTIKIYPNPAANELFIEFRALNEESVNISLFNINGQIVRNVDLKDGYSKNQKLDLNDLSEGIYLLRMLDTEGALIESKRIVIYKE